MTISIGYKIEDAHHFGPVLKSNDARFVEKYGDEVYVPSRYLYRTMKQIARFANNLGEECVFEMEG